MWPVCFKWWNEKGRGDGEIFWLSPDFNSGNTFCTSHHSMETPSNQNCPHFVVMEKQLLCESSTHFTKVYNPTTPLSSYDEMWTQLVLTMALIKIDMFRPVWLPPAHRLSRIGMGSRVIWVTELVIKSAHKRLNESFSLRLGFMFSAVGLTVEQDELIDTMMIHKWHKKVALPLFWLLMIVAPLCPSTGSTTTNTDLISSHDGLIRIEAFCLSM